MANIYELDKDGRKRVIVAFDSVIDAMKSIKDLNIPETNETINLFTVLNGVLRQLDHVDDSKYKNSKN